MLLKVIIFDSSSIISLSLNGLLEELKKLKKSFGGEFVITMEVKKEIVDEPLQRKRFELEAIKIKNLIDEGYLSTPSRFGIHDKEVTEAMNEMADLSNTMFFGDGQTIQIMHKGEASCLALSKILSERNIDNLLVIDERTTRILIEKPHNLKELLEKKMHVKIKLNKNYFKFFSKFRVVRSAELMYVAYKKNMIRWKNNNLLDAILYALKFKGCAISNEDIDEIKRMDKKK